MNTHAPLTHNSVTTHTQLSECSVSNSLRAHDRKGREGIGRDRKGSFINCSKLQPHLGQRATSFELELGDPR